MMKDFRDLFNPLLGWFSV